MNTTFWLVILPLILAATLYLVQALGFQYVMNRPGMAVVFFSYALANAGLLYDALTVGVQR